MATPRRPAALKRLAGNPGRRPIRDDFDAGRLDRVPSPPAWMGAETKAFYRRAGRDLVDLGLLARVDVPALIALAVQWGRWVQAERELNARGPVIVTAHGAQVVNPWLTVCNRAFDRFVALLAQFGGTPVSRTKLSLDKADPAAFDMREFLMAAIEERIQDTDEPFADMIGDGPDCWLGLPVDDDDQGVPADGSTAEPAGAEV
ncbi:MAG TPA: phage terminase small subunit P27 family [candidate division Zixibacteria bacterium]|nr:phage terminase small subunit P27 family [candidate division Zixibacteria bacterium]